jgi:hypothetical protein
MITPLPRSGRALGALLALGGLLAGCEPTGRTPAPPEAAEPAKLAADTTFAEDRPVRVWEVTLRHQLRLRAPTVSDHEPPAVRKLRRQLQRSATLESRLLLHPRRLVWVLPEGAVPGGAAEPLHLVLKPGANVSVLVNHKQRRFRAGTPARLGAWIEGTLKPPGHVARLEVLAERSLTGDRRRLRGLLVLTREDGRQRERAPRYVLRSRSRPRPAEVGKAGALIWDFFLLPMIQATGAPALSRLRARQHWPRYLELAPSTGAPQTLHAPRLRLRLLAGSRRTRQVPARLLRLPPKGYRREFGPLVYKPGRRLLHRPTRGLRPRREGEARSGPVEVTNRFHRAMLVYADGLLIGWVGPRSEASFKVLPAGYYRFSAHSLLGTRRWGPRDAYLPGPLTLRP